MRDKPLGSLGAVPGQGALSSNNRLNKQDLIKILAACLGLSWSVLVKTRQGTTEHRKLEKSLPTGRCPKKEHSLIPWDAFWLKNDPGAVPSHESTIPNTKTPKELPSSHVWPDAGFSRGYRVS